MVVAAVAGAGSEHCGRVPKPSVVTGGAGRGGAKRRRRTPTAVEVRTVFGSISHLPACMYAAKQDVTVNLFY